MANEQIESTVSESAQAKAFLEFQYVEVKDLSKQFLTVVVAVLALSVTFSEKVVNFSGGRTLTRGLMILTWALCLASFVLGGLALYLLYNAGILAKLTVLSGEPARYNWKNLDRAQLISGCYTCLNIAGVSFVLALLLLVVSGLLRIS